MNSSHLEFLFISMIYLTAARLTDESRFNGCFPLDLNLPLSPKRALARLKTYLGILN